MLAESIMNIYLGWNKLHLIIALLWMKFSENTQLLEENIAEFKVIFIKSMSN